MLYKRKNNLLVFLTVEFFSLWNTYCYLNFNVCPQAVYSIIISALELGKVCFTVLLLLLCIYNKILYH